MYKVIMTSCEYGTEEFTGYESAWDALDAIGRLVTKAAKLGDCIDRVYVVDPEPDFGPVRVWTGPVAQKIGEEIGV